ncbi:MAG: hypothetical protein KDD43_02665 [Bdellovibrionales bacterium]|nr:hypothetical protein [Bdellovibrionales bacterium]
MSDEKRNEDDQQPEVSAEGSVEDSGDPQRAVLEAYGISDIAELDKLELSILIVVKNKSPFESAATFLSRRNWPTTVVSSLPEAIQALVAQQPQFVLVSANHPNPKIAKLPLIIAQAFNTRCIGFCEKNDGHSVGQLNAMRVPHRFFGQMSGPSIHRQIKKIVLDEYDAAKPQRQTDATFGGQSEDGTIRVAGGSHDSGHHSLGDGSHATRGPSFVKGEKPDAASLMKMLADSGEDGDDSASDDGNDSLIYREGNSSSRGGRKPQIYFQEGTHGPGSQDPRGAKTAEGGERSSSNSQAGRPFQVSQPKAIKPGQKDETEEEKARAQSGDFLDKSVDGQGLKGHQVEEEGPGSGKEHRADQKGSGPGLEASGTQTGPTGEMFDAKAGAAESGAEKSALQKGPGLAGDSVGSGTDSKSGQGYLGGPAKEGQDHTAGTEAAGTKDLKSQLKSLNAKIPPKSEDMVGLAKAVKKALDEVCRENNQQTKYLVRAPVLGVIPYRSGKQNGFVTVAWADHHNKGSQGFLEALRFSLMNFLPMEGVKASLDQEFILEVDDIHFLKLAEGESEFLIIREHEGLEVGVAFFKGDPSKTHVKKAVDKMVSIKIDDLSTEDPVTFKAYLKMELNQKYVLYLTEGRKILSSQKDRLKKSKVPGLHVNEEDFEKFLRYLSQVEVRNLVRKFNKQESESKSA